MSNDRDRYGPAHRRERRRWAALLASGVAVDCYRCQQPVTAGQRWHLDHTEDGTTYGGPSHATCNIIASNGRAKDPQPRPTTQW